MTGLDPTGADQAAAGAAGDEGNSKTINLYCSALGFTNFTDDDHELLLTNSDDRTGGTNLVQIARTFGNCRGLAGQHITHAGTFTDANGYSHAPDGDFTIASAIVGAIRRAKRFVYIEDQYLGNLKVATALADKIQERKQAVEADPANEEPFFVYIVGPYFPRPDTPNSSARTDLRIGSATSWRARRTRSPRSSARCSSSFPTWTSSTRAAHGDTSSPAGTIC